MQEVYCTVSGLVQKVFFRVYIKEIADVLDLTGFVKNNEDGTVEIIVQSYNEEKIKHFISKVKEGSPMSKVEMVDTKWQSPTKEFEYFVIEY